MSTDNPFVGKWTYRSLLNDPTFDTGFDKLEFGRGTIEIENGPAQLLTGSIGGPGWSLLLHGSRAYGSPMQVRFQGKGIVSGSEMGSTITSAGWFQFGLIAIPLSRLLPWLVRSPGPFRTLRTAAQRLQVWSLPSTRCGRVEETLLPSWDVAIIGGGPAGSAAALALRDGYPELSVGILEALPLRPTSCRRSAFTCGDAYTRTTPNIGPCPARMLTTGPRGRCVLGQERSLRKALISFHRMVRVGTSTGHLLMLSL